MNSTFLHHCRKVGNHPRVSCREPVDYGLDHQVVSLDVYSVTEAALTARRCSRRRISSQR